jgi:hypothetical protein
MAMEKYKCTICGESFDYDELDSHEEDIEENMIEHFAECHPDKIMDFFEEE